MDGRSTEKPIASSKIDPKDITLRFVVGGIAVVLCYLVSKVSPWRAFGGMFAAFPAVMAAAVGMAGSKSGHIHASDVACGAVSGMLAGTVCVASCLILVPFLNSWQVGLAASLVIWLISAAVFSATVSPMLAKTLLKPMK